MSASADDIVICLTKAQLGALGLPRASEIFSLSARAKVNRSTTSDPGNGGVDGAVELVLTHLALAPDSGRRARAQRIMYGGPDKTGGGTGGPFGRLNAKVGG